MKNPTKRHRIIATFFLLIFFPTLVPNNIFASNSGPAAPEATSFEPVDAQDMVNLGSGDMSYVLPLLNVPSPEGGYPLALSYHAGIALDQEASWVGLGWSLNPGAINRSVSGVPDDWKRSNTNLILYDAGGETKSFFGSLSIGWGGEGNYSVGLYGSYTENKTFGGSTSYSTDGGVIGGFGGISMSLGTDGASIGLGLGGKKSNYGGSIGVNQDFKDGSTSITGNLSGKNNSEVSIGKSSIGISFSSKNGLSSSIGGQSQQLSGNKNTGNKINLKGDGFILPIQLYFVNLTLGMSKLRYWHYNNSYTINNGTLYPKNLDDLNNESNIPNLGAFDSYNSIYKLDDDEQLKDDNLSFVAYDNYSVSGQGISGSFKPAILEQGSLKNDKIIYENNSYITYGIGDNNKFTKNINDNINDIHFYFDNEMTSYLRVSSGNWDSTNISSKPFTQMSPLNQQFNTSVEIDGVLQNGYKNSNKRKRTSSYIETFTNKEIIESNSTIIIKPENYNRNTAVQDGIGAFRITALDGKVYHYSLPVYQKEKFMKSTDLDSSFDNRYLEKMQLEPYATHWLLTAITGPDFVDVNLNNMVDKEDYGYWVSFDYGKWSDGFVWKTPLKSNDKTKTYEWGVKEIYYLDKIKTRTHTALFIKEEKQDDFSQDINIGNSPTDLDDKYIYDIPFIKGNDGFVYFYGPLGSSARKYRVDDHGDARYGQYIKTNKHKTLKLSKILLLKNENVNIVKNNGQSIASNFKGQILLNETLHVSDKNSYFYYLDKEIHNVTWFGEYYNNVYDINDVDSNLLQKAIKTIDFNYNSTNPLAKNSTNSMSALKGRLTLDNIEFLGKNSVKIIPPYRFKYINTEYYDSSKEDNWGYYKNKPDEWSLNKIITPTGGEINITYESDDIDKEAVGSERGFDDGLQFTFSNYNGKLRIKVENEYNTTKVNFQDFFQIGILNLDLWVSLKHDYDVVFGGCKARKGSIDIKSNIEVVSVTSSSVVLEANMSSTYDDNGGLGNLYNKIIGLKNHPGMIMENYKRGEWGEPPGCVNVTDRLVLFYRLKGNVKSLSSSDKNGGGIRVKEINVSENYSGKKKIKYFYNVPGFGENKVDTNYKSSGITSFVPQKYFKEIKYISELPSPGVMYEYVTVKEYSSTNELGLIEEYNFDVLKPSTDILDDNLLLSNTLEIEKVQEFENPSFVENSATYRLNLSRFLIKDLTSNIGRLKIKKVFNASRQLLSKDQYYFKNISDIKQGIFEESFNTYKLVRNESDLNYRLGVTSKIKYPSVLEKVEKTQGGYTNTTYFDKYDFLTGQVTETRTVSSDGQSFKTKIVPAYAIAQYNPSEGYGMGSKVDNITNKNMLSQIAAEYSYILDKGSNEWKETGVGITTWSNIWSYKDITGAVTTPSDPKEKIWRKHKTFVWNGFKDNGIFMNYGANDDGFNWTVGVGSQPAQWKQVSETTLYDHFSAPLEMKDINGNLASTKMGDNDSKVMVTGNAGHGEIFYAGAENSKDVSGINWLEPEIKIESAFRNASYFHTGKQSVETTSSSQFGVVMSGPVNNIPQHRQGKYKVSVWVKADNAANAQLKVNGNIVAFVPDHIIAGNWQLKTAYITVPEGACTVYLNSSNGSNVYYDDLMVRPVASSITGYVYNEWDELTYIIGNNGLATKFEYDAAGRLIKTYFEYVAADDFGGGGFKLSKTNTYYNRFL